MNELYLAEAERAMQQFTFHVELRKSYEVQLEVPADSQYNLNHLMTLATDQAKAQQADDDADMLGFSSHVSIAKMGGA